MADDSQFVREVARKAAKLLILTVTCSVLGVGVVFADSHATTERSPSELLDEPIPMKTADEMPQRVPPLIELGDDFLGQGNIPEGFELPTGAVWIPSLWVYGNLRTAYEFIDPGNGSANASQVVAAADLNFNLKLTGTERLFAQIQPLSSNGNFTSYQFEPESGFDNHTNARITRLFFEGDFGEIFPNLDPADTGTLDYGFAVGRQPIFFQEGVMINDVMDSVALVRDTIIMPKIIDTRFTGLWGWGNVNRDDNVRDANAMLFGLFTESDLLTSTVDLDLAYVNTDESDGGDGLYLGGSSVQRISGFNTAFRINYSDALDTETAAVSTGTLLLGEVSTTPKGTHNNLYANAFWGIDEYASAGRDSTAGGPLGRVGLLFAATGLGSYPAALGNRADDAFGGSLGYQMFFNDDRTQFTTEIGGIKSQKSDAVIEDGVAVGARFQQKIFERFLIQVDGFVAHREVRENTAGLRTELLVQF